VKTAGIIVLLLLGLAGAHAIFGGFNAAFITFGSLGPVWLLVFVMIVAALAGIPQTSAPIYRLIQRLSQPSPRARLINSVAIAVLSSTYLYLTAIAEHRQLFPYIHDEFSYLIQAHQFARDRLWMPGHPLSPFFESFQLFAKPVYASAYFPGTALTYLPGVLLRVQPYVTSLIVSGAVVGLLYWIATELLDSVSGWLAALLLLSDGLFRQISTLTLGQMPVLFYGLLATVAWLRWRRNHRTDWAIGIGFFLGLAAATRPVDALCFAIPILIAVLVACAKKKSATAVAGIAVGAIPFLCLQLLLNHGITGDWLRTPFGMYADTEYPGSSYGFHPYDPQARPRSNLPQMQRLYNDYRPLIQLHQPANVLNDLMRNRMRFVFSQTSPAPFPLLVLLLPLSLLGFGYLNRTQRLATAIVLAPLPLFLILYCGYFLSLPTYVLPTAPAVILCILLGAKVISNAWSSARRFATVGLTLFIFGTALAAFPNWSRANPEDVFRADLLASVNHQLASLSHRPAVVLFTYDRKRDVHQEPVYNADSAWPDDSPVIRAHDLGSRDREIYRYYAERQPARFFYRFDETSQTLHPLGSAVELANRP
jgi:hypothetical protein